MTILIEFEKKQSSRFREVQLRKDIGIFALEIYEKGYFEPTGFVIWKDAVLEELGGKLIVNKDLDLSQIHLLKEFIEMEMKSIDSQTINDTIIRIDGKWKFNSSTVRGFVSINNAYGWRKAYGDVDIDIYPGQAGDDLMTFLWMERETLVDNFFQNFLYGFDNRYKNDASLHWLAFASGIPSREDISSIKAAYYDSLWPFITNMLLTYSEQNKGIQKSYRRKYLTQQMFKEDEFKKSILHLIKKFRISKTDSHSMILIGEGLDSFSNLYEEISKRYLIPIFDKLPRDEQINAIIKRITSDQETIDSYSGDRNI